MIGGVERWAVRNVNVVTPSEVVRGGYVVIRGGIIEHVGTTPGRAEEMLPSVDGQGCWLLPGFIDLHNDAIEKEIEPRPKAFIPVEIAFLALEHRLVSHGVTSIYHSLSFASNEFGIRSLDRVEAIVRELRSLGSTGRIRHMVHGRYEITDERACDVLAPLIDEGYVHLLSLMDHTPGQGQFRQLEDYANFMSATYQRDYEEIAKFVQVKQATREVAAVEYMNRLTRKAKDAGISIASHDDDTVRKVQVMNERGVTLSEFPVTMEAARAATECGMGVMVGAPNVVRGGSTSNNLKATDAILAHSAQILCSDYMPSSILHAVFTLHFKHGMRLNEAVNLASLNPARVLGLELTSGSITPGKIADFSLVRLRQRTPIVERAFVNGSQVLHVGGSEHPRSISLTQQGVAHI
ncbi:alpha-D-ribose 1-methylphosphonate 5-triphosphate diphosphatase [Alicyclobacillus fastidiosus]|uniref:Alpha-D-ribose 1-methylphosphonate 5-triphosphate diphosphatase n=1 Tax=Alicyclobacillus fastidiosus TaxID=392011 RepID=A0ABY6ZQ77_9BACL|nr:alpha-D-ribose 1-methylphosphonate 5-triphosphate diphosphatase [Alicyclobacillus fastidiosus]WAH44602.1 alpha-D-ribose 1-methylphosphonate 5-triphosphate diphosphatase [Alicyclobacillus fastidiosus]